MKQIGVPLSKWSGASDRTRLILMVIIDVVLFVVFFYLSHESP